MSWWILAPILYALGGFITLTIYMCMEPGKLDVTVESDIHTALGLALAWPVIAFVLAAMGSGWLVLHGAQALSRWLRNAAK